ncbi:DUF4190 domain-containing protein [Promicromonospora sp. Populi]|uniref:DUF4190 domain-containing protein n=1 Tax=Promicromonospora sp. Populi TaxID=3239420 RepID=UPI0034E1BEF4
MTENDGGTPRDPQPETPPTQPLPGSVPESSPTQPLPESPLSAEQPPESQPEPTPYAPQEPAASYSEPQAPVYAQPGAPVAAPQYGYAETPPKNDLAVWSLVTGILSYILCPLLLGIAAIITGTMGRRAADEGLANNRGMATAGLVLGWVNVGLSVLGIVFFFIAIAVGLFAGGVGTVYEMNNDGIY